MAKTEYTRDAEAQAIFDEKKPFATLGTVIAVQLEAAQQGELGLHAALFNQFREGLSVCTLQELCTMMEQLDTRAPRRDGCFLSIVEFPHAIGARAAQLGEFKLAADISYAEMGRLPEQYVMTEFSILERYLKLAINGGALKGTTLQPDHAQAIAIAKKGILGEPPLKDIPDAAKDKLIGTVMANFEKLSGADCVEDLRAIGQEAVRRTDNPALKQEYQKKLSSLPTQAAPVAGPPTTSIAFGAVPPQLPVPGTDRIMAQKAPPTGPGTVA